MSGGTIVSITPDRRGGTLATATTGTDAVLVLEDATDFDEAGGWLVVADSAPLAYTGIDDDTETITLLGTAGAVYEAGLPVDLWDPTVSPAGAKVVEYKASVDLGNGVHPGVVIPHEKVPLAGINSLIGASVTLTDDDEIDQILAREPTVDGSFLGFSSNHVDEALPGYIDADVSGDFARLVIAAPDTDEPDKETTTYRNMILMYEDVTDTSPERASRTVTVRTSHFYIETAGGDYIHVDGSGGTPLVDLVGGFLDNVTMINGDVGVNSFRDSVDARANAMSAARMQAGTASSGTVVAATAKVVTVTFPTAFSSAPKAMLTDLNSDPGVDRRAAVVPGSETTTQFQIAFWRATGTASFDANWFAVKP